MSEISANEREACATCGAVVANAIVHDAWHAAANSTEAEIEAGLRGSGV